MANDPNYLRHTIQRRIAPRSVERLADGSVVVDFGKEAFGFLELLPPPSVRGAYVVRLGELLADGRVDMEPGATIRAAEVASEIVADGTHRVPLVSDARNTSCGREGGAVRLPPEHGVVMPFRYVEVVAAPFEITCENIRMVAVVYPMALDESSFSCDNDALNQVYDFCKYSIYATSFAGLYVDGDRERIPYEADAYLNQLGDYAVHSDYAMARASHEYLMEHPTWPTEWKQHSIKMAWADLMWTGDTRSAEKYYGILKDEKLLLQFSRGDGLLATGGERNKGSLVNDKGAADIVDWPVGERDGFVFKDVNAVVNAFHYRNLLEMADIARAVGETGDASWFEERAMMVNRSFNEVFFDEAMGIYRDGEGADHASLHANAAALAFGLVPDVRKDAVADFCVSRGMACSVYFAQYLLEALFEAGRAGEAIALMTSTGDRSWLGMMEQGATITMEAWAPKYKQNLDMNHAWGTAPLNVISRYVLGVQPLAPWTGKIRIRPSVGALSRIKGRVPTRHGHVEILVDGNHLVVDTPVAAEIVFAGHTTEVPAGHWES